MMNELMIGACARRKELLVGCGVEVKNENQARSVYPPHSYPYPKAYCDSLLQILLVTTFNIT
jgi:hypothetical protein